MSLSRQQIRAQRAAAAEARRLAQAEPEAAAPAVPGPAGEVDLAPSPAPPASYRPQAFTPDLIPEPVEVDAEGDLTPDEIDDLEHCEAAFGHSNQAEWMKWKAAHAVRARRLHRQGGRTWPVYCEATFGESESEVNRRIQQWPLLKAITEQQSRPRAIPDSHVQQLLPMAEQHGEGVTAGAYVALRMWAADRKHRVTAEVVVGLVELARAAETPALTTTATFQQAIEAKTKPKRSEKEKPLELAPTEEGTTEVVTEPDGEEQNEPSTGGHPNLGDSQTGDEAGTGGDEDVVDAEIVTDGSAVRTRDALQGILTAVGDGALNGARAEMLKEISAAARSIAEAAEEVLKDR